MRRRLAALAGAGLVLPVLAGCGGTVAHPVKQAAASTSTDPCVAWAQQQVSATFKPANVTARGLGFESGIRVDALKDGLCLDTSTEFHAPGWKVSAITISATGHGQDGLPVTFTRTGTDKSEALGALYVPLEGCVRVTGTVRATKGAETALWRAGDAYGRGCKAYRG